MSRRARGLAPKLALEHNNALVVGNNINALELRMIRALYYDVPFTAQQAVGWLFPAETIRKMQAAYGLVYYSPSVADYSSKMEAGVKVGFKIQFDKLHMVAPEREQMGLLPVNGPLADMIGAMYCTCEKFQRVRNVFDWLNKNATVGAMRYYWPTILSLCQDGTIVADGKRWREPQGISELLPDIRGTAATVASAILVPEAAPSVDDKPISIGFTDTATGMMTRSFAFA